MKDSEIASASDWELEDRRLFLIGEDTSEADQEIEVIEREIEARDMDRHDYQAGVFDG